MKTKPLKSKLTKAQQNRIELEQKEGEQFSFNRLDWNFNLFSYLKNKITFDDSHLRFWNLLFKLATEKTSNSGFVGVYNAFREKVDNFPEMYAGTAEEAFYRRCVKELFDLAFGIYDPNTVENLQDYWCCVFFNTPSRIARGADSISSVVNFKAENDKMAFDMLLQAWLDEDRSRSWQVINFYNEKGTESFPKMAEFVKFLGEDMTRVVCF